MEDMIGLWLITEDHTSRLGDHCEGNTILVLDFVKEEEFGWPGLICCDPVVGIYVWRRSDERKLRESFLRYHRRLDE